MSELTRRRDTSRNEETWLIFLEDVHIGTIGDAPASPSMPSNGAGAAASFQDRNVAPVPRARLRTSIRRGSQAAKLYRR